MAKSLTGALDDVSHKWRRLAERRQQDLTELFHNGRWKHYYTEEQFMRHMREAVRLTERWATIAPPSSEKQFTTADPSRSADSEAAASGTVRRDAA